jgi:hypothetical protein
MKKYTAFLLCLMLSALVGIAGADMIVDGDQRKDPFPWEDHEIEDGRADPVFAYLPLARDMKARKGLGWAEPNAPTRVEDFTSYTEVDPGADITVAADTITFTDLSRNVESYVYKDFGTDYWSGDFEHRFKVNYSASAASGLVQVWGMANSVESIENITQHISIWLYAGRFYIRERDVSWDAGTSLISGIATDTDYYLKIVRDDSEGTYGTLYLYVYSDLNFSTLIGSTSLALRVKLDFRYIYALSTYNDSNAATVSGTVSYLQLDTANYFDGNLVVKANGGEARFEPDGYLDEPESTNLLLSSRVLDVDDANWGGTVDASDCVQNETGVDGAANTAWTLTDDNDSAVEYLYQIVSKVTTDETYYTASIRVKKTTSDPVYPRVGLRFTGGTNISAFLTLKRSDGTYNTTGNCGDPSYSVTSQGDWWLVSISGYDSEADNDEVWLYINPAHNTVGNTSNENAAQGSTVFDFAQLENRSTATSPIYTTSTAVTRPADSFSLTMTDAFKEKFAEALGSELAPDFGAVLGDELISDAGDIEPDGGVGNWSFVEGGAGGSLTYDTTSLGFFQDKHWKLTCGDSYTYMYLTDSNFGSILDNDTMYVYMWVYADPNNTADITFSHNSWPDSPDVKDVTLVKGVWQLVESIVTRVSEDGNIRVGFSSANAVSGDILYVGGVSFRKNTFSTDWTAGTGWRVKYALQAPSLGDEELSNGDFSAVTEGSDLVTDGDMDVAGSWSIGTGWAIGSSVATWTYGSGAGNLAQTAILTAGRQYRIYYDVTANTFDGDFKIRSSTTDPEVALSKTVGTDHNYDFVANGTGATSLTLRCANGTGGAISIDNVIVEEITLDGHDTPTVDADDYLEYDTDNDRVRLVATDGNAKLSQTAVTVGTLYYYEIDIETVTSGRIKLVNTDCETYDKPINDTNTVVKMSTSGVHSGVFRAGNTVVEIWRDAFPTDITINSWSIKPYTPSHVNTDPRFDRQTEGADAVANGDFANWTGDDPDNWTVISEDANNYVTETVGGAAQIVSDNSANVNLWQTIAVTENTRRKLTFDIAINTLGWRFKVYDLTGGVNIIYRLNGNDYDNISNFTETGEITVYYTVPAGCSQIRIYFYRNASGASDFEIDNVVDVPVSFSTYTGTDWFPADGDGGAIHVAGSSQYVLGQNVGVDGTYYLFLWKTSGSTAGGTKAYSSGIGSGDIQTGNSTWSAIQKTAGQVVGISPTTGFDGVVDYAYIIPLSDGPVAHCTGSQSANTTLYSGDVLVDDADHKISFTLDNVSAGGINRVGVGSDGAISVNLASDDDYTFYDTETGALHGIYLRAGSTFVGDITALSAKEVTRHAAGTVLLALSPGYSYGDIGENRQIIQLQDAAYAAGFLYEDTNGFFRTYCGSGGYAASADVDYATNTTYLIAIQWGDTISNVNYYRAGAVALDSPWTSGAWGSDAEFDGAYTLGTDLTLFYSKFGSNNLRDIVFLDGIADDYWIEEYRQWAHDRAVNDK